MSLNLSLSDLSVPAGTEFPGGVQALLQLITEYVEITGGDNFNGMNFGDTEPGPDDRDKPWFKTDASGNPLGLLAWDGTAWTSIPLGVPRGETASRPNPASEGLLYFDTTINVLLVYERSQWRTASGSPGDVKFVATTTSEDALAKNPGWSIYAAAAGRVLGGVGTGSGLTEREYGDTVGAEEVTLTTEQMPIHNHQVSPKGETDSSSAGSYVESAPGPGPTLSPLSSTNAGGDQPHNNMQPTLFLWCLKKD